MEPTIKTDKYELYLGDCRQILPFLEPVDLLLTDPPYGIGRDGKPKSTSRHGGHKGYDFLGWDKFKPDAKLFSEMFAKSRQQIIWGANYFTKHLPASSGWLMWDKGQRIDQADGELAFTSRQKALRVFTLNRAAIAQDGAVHPTQKPVALMCWCLGFVPDAHRVLDPFMGSGTTGVACLKLGRYFIGIEREERYFEIARKRLEDAAAQGDLFEAQADQQPSNNSLQPTAYSLPFASSLQASGGG